ncbi:MAG: hypothetical protein O7C01_11725 [Actinobacteria bacterium]|nr:hypothetical protein [Actinomycetota bacterium]
MRKKLTAVVLAVLVFSLIAASAASLGGINTADLGADATVVASCDTDGVDVDYTVSYVPGAPGNFDVATVVVTNINVACNTYAIEVSLGDGTTELGNGSDTVAAGAATVTISAGADAELVTELGIVISN